MTVITSRHTVTLLAPSGRPLLALGVLPAAAVAATALVLAPRVTALAALAALARKMSLAIGTEPPA